VNAIFGIASRDRRRIAMLVRTSRAKAPSRRRRHGTITQSVDHNHQGVSIASLTTLRKMCGGDWSAWLGLAEKTSEQFLSLKMDLERGKDDPIHEVIIAPKSTGSAQDDRAGSSPGNRENPTGYTPLCPDLKSDFPWKKKRGYPRMVGSSVVTGVWRWGAPRESRQRGLVP